MSDRLKQLRNALRAHAGDDFRDLFVSGRADEFLGLVLETVEAEIAEREAPPPVLESAIAEILHEHDIDREIVIATQTGWPETRGARLLTKIRYRLEALALRGARPATRVEWLAVAFDLAQDEGEVSEGLARTVASMLPTLAQHESVRKAILDLPIAEFNGTLFGQGDRLSERRPANAPTCNGCGGTGLQTRGVVVSACPVCGGRRWVPPIEPVTQPEEAQPDATEWRARGAAEIAGDEAQPDASWLRHVRRRDGDVRPGWVYEGPTEVVAAVWQSGTIPLLAWLEARGALIDGERFNREGVAWVRIVTRAPLDGDWCARCGQNIEHERFDGSATRLVKGEMRRVCESCEEGWP